MNFAVLGDIDGHVEVLRAALDAIENEGIVTVFQTGNIAWGDGGSAAIALLRERGVRCVQGARDRVLSKFERKRARLVKELGKEFAEYDSAHEALRAADVEWLGKLPHELRVELDLVRVLICHGMPGDQQEYFDAGSASSRVERARESADAEIVASGGGAKFFVRAVGDCLLINAPVIAGERGAAWVRVTTDEGKRGAVVVEI